MAVDYTTLFTRLGRFVYWTNAILDYQLTTLLASNGVFDDVNDEYTARPDLLSGYYAAVDQMAASQAAWIGQFQNYTNKLLADLQAELNTQSSDAASILAALSVRMVADSATIKANTITSPSISAGGSNVGTGSLVATKTNYTGVDDERIISEVVAVTCVSDRFSGVSAGAEAFQIVGYPKQDAKRGDKTRGSGGPATIVLADASANNKVSNGSFDSFTSNVPASWTIDAGTAGTHVLSESTTTQRSGATSLKLAGNGVTTTITLSQSLATKLFSRKQYGAGIWIRKGGTVSSGSNLAIRITGTGISTVNLFNADPNTLTTSFALKSAFLNLNAVVPTDLKIEITWTSANSAGASAVLYIDDCAVAETIQLGRVGYVMFRGATDFLRNDKFTVTTANNYGGKFQTFLGRMYDVALPSSGSPSINDSLAT